MRQLPPRLRIYICGVIAVAAMAVLVAFAAGPHHESGHDVALAFVLAAFAVLAYLRPVTLASSRQLVLHTGVQMLALIVLETGPAALVAGVSVLAGNLLRRRHPLNAFFNTAHTALGVVLAGALFHDIVPTSEIMSAGPRFGVALLAAGAVLFLVSTLAVDAVGALQGRRSLFKRWWPSHQAPATSHLMMVVLGAAGAAAVQEAPWLLLILLIAVLMLHSTAEATAAFQAHASVLAREVADAIDERHSYLHGASLRLSGVADQVARAHGLPEEVCRDVTLAARMHNIAAALLPDYIELGTAAMDEHQRAFWQTHPERGATLVAEALGAGAVAAILQYHHERLDGKGYPRGLHGADIPLAARVLSVCEGWVALTSDRGYRPALPVKNAWPVMEAGAGSQWDADVVRTLGRLVGVDAAAAIAAKQADTRVAVA